MEDPFDPDAYLYPPRKEPEEPSGLALFFVNGAGWVIGFSVLAGYFVGLIWVANLLPNWLVWTFIFVVFSGYFLSWLIPGFLRLLVGILGALGGAFRG